MTKTTDVAIIGGGVIGCAAAYALSAAGVRVVLLERGQVACEASGEAAGMLAPRAEAPAAGPPPWRTPCGRRPGWTSATAGTGPSTPA
ncbi:MAG: FAD-dependent oxidoreductase [candidate division NC10 bacterium]|nr:FAD-dependent oxidoreductase [candidate division NC10 bacterium]